MGISVEQRLEKSCDLSDDKLAAIRRLEAACSQTEGLTMKLNWHTLQHRLGKEANDFFYYENDRLIGYLALYTFNKREAEVSALTHPDYRRQGIFKQLLAAARSELQQRRVPEFLFICEQRSLSAVRTMAAVGARYDFSEYKMTLRDFTGAVPVPADLQIRPAVIEDTEALAQMDEICFDVPIEHSKRHLQEDLKDRKRRIFVASSGPDKVGKTGVTLTETEAYIFALCVLPPHRRQGYGGAILANVVEQLLAEGLSKIALEVACVNETALSIYKRCGFEVVTAYDYYRLPVS
jgi:ribosomal protein S18 acetylase RimI-like enzyme